VPGVAVRVVERCTSTNDLALKADGPILIAAEEQTAGRGRRGRRWHSAPGAGVTFSLGRRIGRPVRELAALSLVAGVACARALRTIGVDKARLKWPNDLLADGAKLGGILVETRSGYAVIGIGINCRRDRRLAAKVRRSVAFVSDYVVVPRNQVIAQVGRALMEALDVFDAQGLAPLRAQWEAMDAYAGQRLRIRLADGRVISGTSGGLAEDGALQLLTRKGMQAVRSGRVLTARAA
jgi:BirA family transcriptional regulator, biotin operon repressor / biotin---[acetyl-CoA-carboxylase] ligase